MYNWHFWFVFFLRYARIYVRPSFSKWFSIVGMIWSHYFFRFQPKPPQRGCVAVAVLNEGFCFIQRVLWRVWNVEDQCGPGVSKGLDNLAIPSVSVRPGWCLFLPCLMNPGILADSDTAATVSSGGCRGYAVESTCIAAVAFSFTRHRGRSFIQQAPQLQLWFRSAVDGVTWM